MTAARLAGIIRDTEGENREDHDRGHAAARLTSSQLAAAIGNVLVVVDRCVRRRPAVHVAAGRTFFTKDEAIATLRGLSPIDSITIRYAILTGVVLWMASIAGGWFDNWCVYHRIPEGIAQPPRRGAIRP